MTAEEMFATMRWSREERAEFRAQFPRLHREIVRGSPWSIEGANIGRGWKPLLERVFTIAEDNPEIKVLQVKEKWASLRIYLRKVDDGSELARVLKEVKAGSHSMCEACGKFGEIACVKPDFVKTVCIEHLPDGASYLPALSDEFVL